MSEVQKAVERVRAGLAKEGRVAGWHGEPPLEGHADLRTILAELERLQTEDARELDTYINLALVDPGANPPVSWRDRAQSAERQRDAALEALKFYADRLNWRGRVGDKGMLLEPLANDDGGHKARSALAGTQKQGDGT